MSVEKDAALEKAIKSVGNAAELAAKLGITAQALSQWARVPVLRVLEVERATGISRHELRPDFYPQQTERRRVRASA